MLCTVTAVAPDGKRSAVQVEARTVNYAAVEYNYRARVGNSTGIVVPERETVFEIDANGVMYRTSWDQVLKWGAEVAQQAIDRARKSN